MEELYNLGISNNTIKSMIELVPNIKDMSINDVREKEILLKNIGCNREQVVNIISSNAMFLDRTNGELERLIDKLNNLGFTSLNILFDSNPYILNLEPFEIDNYIAVRLTKGELFGDIIDEIESNTYLFNDM